MPSLTSLQVQPSSIFAKALKAVPALKYALGIAGIAALIAIIAAWKIDPLVTIFGIVIMLIFMVVLRVFAVAAVGGTAVAGGVLLWFCLILFMATATVLFTSVFWDGPIPLKSKIFPSSSASHEPPKAAVKSAENSATNDKTSDYTTPKGPPLDLDSVRGTWMTAEWNGCQNAVCPKRLSLKIRETTVAHYETSLTYEGILHIEVPVNVISWDSRTLVLQVGKPINAVVHLRYDILTGHLTGDRAAQNEFNAAFGSPALDFRHE